MEVEVIVHIESCMNRIGKYTIFIIQIRIERMIWLII